MMVKTMKKATMVKDVVGKVRTSTRELPSANHTYGALVAKDAEGAGAVISTWDVSKPSIARTSDRDLIRTNVLAIHYGNITAKDARLFAQAHPEIRFAPPGTNVVEGGGRKRDKVRSLLTPQQESSSNQMTMRVLGQYRGKLSKIPFDGPYGTKSEKMACPLSALIEARFTDFTHEGKDYPDVSVLEKKFRMPPPRETKASQGHNATLKPVAKEKSQFVMKRFKNVPGRVNPPNQGHTRPMPARV